MPADGMVATLDGRLTTSRCQLHHQAITSFRQRKTGCIAACGRYAPVVVQLDRRNQGHPHVAAAQTTFARYYQQVFNEFVPSHFPSQETCTRRWIRGLGHDRKEGSEE